MTRETAILLRPDKAGDAIKSLAPLRALRAHLKDWDIIVLASEHNAILFLNGSPPLFFASSPSDWRRDESG